MNNKCIHYNRDVKFSVENSEDSGMVFTGYGAAFGNVDSYGEVIERGAFKSSISKFKKNQTEIPMLLQHGFDSLEPIGKWVDMKEDDHGLLMRGKVSNTQRGKDTYTLISDGAISGLSIGFYPVKTRNDKVGKEDVTILEEVNLAEVSVVTFPANTLARVTGTKSEHDKKRLLEFILRDAGFSKKEQKTIVSKCFEEWNRDDSASKELVAAMNLIKQYNKIFTWG